MVEAFQVLALAGTGDAEPGLDEEQCSVRGALYQCAIGIQELVFLPLQRSPQMRTVIVVDMQ